MKFQRILENRTAADIREQEKWVSMDVGPEEARRWAEQEILKLRTGPLKLGDYQRHDDITIV